MLLMLGSAIVLLRPPASPPAAALPLGFGGASVAPCSADGGDYSIHVSVAWSLNLSCGENPDPGRVVMRCRSKHTSVRCIALRVLSTRSINA